MACRSSIPGLITDAEFLQEQALLGSGYAAFVNVEAYVQSGLHIIVLSTDPAVEVALLDPFVQNLNTVAHLKTATLLRQATDALERHITDTTGQTFNDYLFTHGLKVSQDFAALSAALGQSISPLNIA